MDLDARPPIRRYHSLHDDTRHWPEANCYIDLWIGLLDDAGLDPVAGLGFALAQDYEGDQFTFGKYAAEDLERLYGLSVRELSLFFDLATHLATQTAMGRTVLVEVDAYHLPDTRGLTYRRAHGKTAIGVQTIDPAAERLGYFHNSGFHVLEREDFRGALTLIAPDMPPYAEVVSRCGTALTGVALRTQARTLLRRHARRMPRTNPVAAWREAFPAQLAMLQAMPPGAFHPYAFHHLRQFGSNFELLASHLAWLGEADGFGRTAIAPALRIAEQTKSFQFRLARLVAQRRSDPCDAAMDALEASYDAVAQAIRKDLD